MSINFLDPVTNYGTVQSRVNANFAALKAYTDEKVGSIRDELTVVNGGTVNLDDSLPAGSLLGYKVTATTTIEGFEFGPGDYVFTRTSDGWEYRRLADAIPIGAVPDDTPPIGGTLSTSDVTGSSFRMTVTGASDPDSGLHPSPYRFSVDGGSTWSAWQSSNVYDATGLSPETTYQPRAQVRNNALPSPLSATVSAADVTTGELPITGDLFSDDFDTDDGAVTGRVTTTGNKTWLAPSGDIDGAFLAYGAVVSDGALVATDSGLPGYNRIDVGVTDFQALMRYAISPTVSANQPVIGSWRGSGQGVSFRINWNGNTSERRVLKIVDGTQSTCAEWSHADVPVEGTAILKVEGASVSLTLGGKTHTHAYAGSETSSVLAVGYYGTGSGLGVLAVAASAL